MTVQMRSHGGSPVEVLRVFAKLGVTSFGGPIAHIGYFRHEFVVRRRWLDEPAYADLVGLCQFLPGPASSQVGFSLGLMRAGYIGGTRRSSRRACRSSLLSPSLPRPFGVWRAVYVPIEAGLPLQWWRR